MQTRSRPPKVEIYRNSEGKPISKEEFDQLKSLPPTPDEDMPTHLPVNNPLDYLKDISSFQLKTAHLAISGLQVRQTKDNVRRDLRAILKFLGLMYCDELLNEALDQKDAEQLGNNENSTIRLVLQMPYVFKAFPDFEAGEKKLCQAEFGIPQYLRSMFDPQVDSQKSTVRYTITAVEDSLDLTTVSPGAVIINPCWDEDLLSQQIAALIIYLSLLHIPTMPDLDFCIYPTPFFTWYNKDNRALGKHSSTVLHILIGRYDHTLAAFRSLNDGEVEVL